MADSEFVNLRILDNFYQTSSYFPLPVVLVCTESESGEMNLGSYSLCSPDTALPTGKRFPRARPPTWIRSVRSDPGIGAGRESQASPGAVFQKARTRGDSSFLLCAHRPTS